MKRMKGRYKVISIFTFLLLILQILLITTTHAIDLYLLDNQKNIKIVDKTGNWDYINIQEAIDNEPEGTTIFVKNGIYNEILYIDKKINLIGENKDNTIILSESMQNRYSICLNSPNVKLENLSIKNSGPGLYCSGIKITAPNTQINDCFIYDTPVGIAIFTSYNTINNCEFYGCSDEGIVLLGTSYSDCKYNKISNCKFYENCDGIELQYSTDNIITNCIFYNNTHTAIDAIASSNDRNMILSCDIYNNDVHGVFLSSSSYNRIIDCNILDNDNGDIVINRDSKYNEVISKSNSYTGVFLSFLLYKKFEKPILKIISRFKEKIINIA